MDNHFVLTRAGFMHWFQSPDDVGPIDGINLGCCQFEEGEAPEFKLLEGGVPAFGKWLGFKGRRFMFRASSVEECCDWAIALREAIAVASS